MKNKIDLIKIYKILAILSPISLILIVSASIWISIEQPSFIYRTIFVLPFWMSGITCGLGCFLIIRSFTQRTHFISLIVYLIIALIPLLWFKGMVDMETGLSWSHILLFNL